MHFRSALLFVCSAGLYAQSKPFDVRAMLTLQRLSEPQLSPDGKNVAYTVQTVDLDRNAKPRQIYTVPLEGGAPVAITKEPGSNYRPRWSPDGKQIAFISSRGGSSQVWVMDADGTNPRQVTSLSTEADGVLFSPDGKRLLFTSDVYPGCEDDECNKTKLEAEQKNLVKARVYTSLLYRHWTDYQGGRRKHLMAVDVAGGPVKDLTPGNRDVPPFSLGGPDDYTISPDGKEAAYVSNPETNLALSTNNEVYVVSIKGGEAKKISVSTGADNSPVYSPDGKYIAYRSQARGGYESDLWKLVVYERASGKTTVLTDALDRPVESLTWSPDSTRIFFVVADRGRTALQMVSVKGGGAKSVITGKNTIDDVQLAPDGKTMIYTAMSGSAPVELYKVSSTGGSPVALTKLNDELLADYRLSPLEDFYVESPDKARVHSFLVKPPDFQAGRKYPVVFLIHGGPEGAWGESWSYRWNPQVFAAAGYVVVMPNPRGSTGYGQKFTEEIQADWGGKAFEDIMAVVDNIAKRPYVDHERMAAAGASYGGYMVDWMLGHTDRFKALVTHAGVYDLRSMVGETEELWFPLWEFKGMPWDDPELYSRWSPSYFVKDFKTPTLVTHGELDYRVPVGQGQQIFTALQLQKVPSKMVLFPDEGHWILKPQNTVLWYGQVLDWVGEWTKKPGSTGTR